MADAMKLLPCPFCGGADLEATFHYFSGAISCKACEATLPLPTKSPDTQAAAWNRRASPPAREEAPAEGLVRAALHDADDISGRISAGGYRANLSDVECLRNHVRKLSAHLRNRTSEPEAGAVRHHMPEQLHDGTHDEAMAWVWSHAVAIRRDNGDMDYSLGAVIAAFEAGKSAHPATADKLRGAVAALEAARDAFAEIVTGDIHHSGPNIDTDVMREGDVSSTWVGVLGRIAKRARKATDTAIAALNEQPQ